MDYSLSGHGRERISLEFCLNPYSNGLLSEILSQSLKQRV